MQEQLEGFDLAPTEEMVEKNCLKILLRFTRVLI